MLCRKWVAAAVAEDEAAINNRFAEINRSIKKPLLFGRGFFMEYVVRIFYTNLNDSKNLVVKFPFRKSSFFINCK